MHFFSCARHQSQLNAVFEFLIAIAINMADTEKTGMRYKLFGQHTGLRVSELMLGAGNFGTRWGHGAEPDEARRILDAYATAGGNFIDTANGYQFGQSEEILGDLLAGRRDDFVPATKFTMGTDPNAGILVTGNSRKAMVSRSSRA
jgi:aryl-alcohol dehydrogenase-like predicted oxidoreductase